MKEDEVCFDFWQLFGSERNPRHTYAENLRFPSRLPRKFDA
jgi:hypothetical protein